MRGNQPMRRSIASGCVWAIIGLALGFLFAAPERRFGHLVLTWAGGIITAPLIGLLMGRVSRIFGYFEEVLLRIIVAGASLYLAMVLFIMSSFLARFVFGPHLPPHIWTNVFGGAALAFELTCMVLWPLAYLNHTFISRWAQGRSGSYTL